MSTFNIQICNTLYTTNLPKYTFNNLHFAAKFKTSLLKYKFYIVTYYLFSDCTPPFHVGVVTDNAADDGVADGTGSNGDYFSRGK